MENTEQGPQRFRVVAWWSSGRTGLTKCDSAPNAIHFTAPPAFGGLEGRWTPEDLLLGAVASCYTTTVRALAEHAHVKYADLAVEVEGTIAKTDTGFAFSEVVILPKITVTEDNEQPIALRLLRKAADLCLVSRALSVKQTLDPRVEVVNREWSAGKVYQ